METGTWKQLLPHEIKPFCENVLFSPERKRPIIALSTNPETKKPWIDPEVLAGIVRDNAEVVVVETGAVTRALAAAVPAKLELYGGAARIWWPGLTRESDPMAHKLFLIRSNVEAAQATQKVLELIDRWVIASRPPRKDDAALAWYQIGKEYRVGDVVPGRVFRLDPQFALVELLPGAGVKVPLDEIDYLWVNHPEEVLQVGEYVNVLLLDLDAGNRRGTASIKQALHATARPGIGMRPGDEPYVDRKLVDESHDKVRQDLRSERAERRRLETELGAATTKLAAMEHQVEDLRRQVAELRRESRSSEDRARELQSRLEATDPLTSETAFLAAVRVEYALRFSEADRKRYPLAAMRIGREFLRTVRELQGVDISKILEVCAQVASGRAPEIPGRAVHELGDGSAAAPVTRSTDGARAWRCALQVGSASARRLHWWLIPGAEGPTIEFAGVAVHDDFTIPA